MRQIGINQYAGELPWVIESYIDAKKEIDRDKARKLAEFKELTPSERFFALAKEEVPQPAKYSPEYFTLYRFQDHALVEFERLEQKNFPDIEGVRDFVVHLRSIYVVDAFRSTGVATRTFEQIRDICERSGAILILYASAFGFSKDGRMRNGFTSWDELWTAVFNDGYELVYLHDWLTEVAEEFYRRVGMQTVCLNSPDLNPENRTGENWWCGHFAFIPDSLEQKYSDRFAERMNPGVSKYCQPGYDFLS